MPRMSMVEAIRDAMDCKMAEDKSVVVFGEDVGYFGGVFRCTDGLQRKYGKSRCFDAPINEFGNRRRGDRHGRLWAEGGRRDPVRRLCLSRLRPDRVGGGAAALPLGRRILRADRDPHAVRRRHLWRADAQPEPRGLVHPCLRPQDRHPFQPLRRQRSSDRLDRGRRSGHLSRAETALQRPVHRPSRAADRALGKASFERGAGGALRRAARQGGDAARGQGGHGALLWHDGPCLGGGSRGDRRRCGDHRSAHAAAARHRRHRGFGEQDRPLRHRA